ncbi:AAA family ATPase [Shimazuella sp. AN120528]|uniref:AAA family ATPase n=1 Tax=Shimazuella soli TaxID=1892854 RepID=UPI001F0F7264|nr:AAA family ATPase [Shimazuella soli]MCH5586200.1 AAA family ATPase [Shimazuella soli]
MSQTPIQKGKAQLTELLYTRVRSDGYRRISPTEMNIWRKKSEGRTDQYLVSYPILRKFRYILVGYFSIPWIFKLAILFTYIIVSWNFIPYFFVLLLVTPIWLGVLGYFIELSSQLTEKMGRGSELDRFRNNMVHYTNLIIDLVNLDQDLYSYRVASCGTDYPDWFDFYLEKQQAYSAPTPFQEQKYLEVYLNQRIYHYAVQQKEVYFRINIMGQTLLSEEERQKQLDKMMQQASLSTPNHQGWKYDFSSETAVSTFELKKEDKDQLLKEAMIELDNMIGLAPVKEFVHEMKDMVAIQIERAKIGQNVQSQSLHMIYTGNPGTGKTTVARIVAKIFKALGVVSKGHLVEVTREDLVGEYIGHTAPKTRKVIEKAIGGILFIDEAYALSRGGDNDFGKEAIDTLVKGMEENREDLVVILAGYTKEMMEFMKVNSGLKSRFPSQIKFPDYTAEELLSIAKKSLEQEQFQLDPQVEKTLLSVLERRQIAGRNDDGNGRLVRNVIQEAIRKQSKRLKQDGYRSPEELKILRPEDFGVNQTIEVFDLEAEFDKIIGNEKVKEHIRSLVAQVKIQKLRRDQGFSKGTGQSLHMIFKGNPGTGKTTFARIIGKALKELGVLKSGQLIETDRSGLVATHIGQTAQKVNEIVQEALGGILFIDEAYALASKTEGDFGKEAIDTLVKAIEDYRENLLVILAGYDHDMDVFLQTNVGLTSRFPNVFQFSDYTVDELYLILLKITEEEQYQLLPECKNVIYSVLRSHVQSGKSSNGRFVRNLFEHAVRKQSVRLGSKGNIDKEDLAKLLPEDFI